MGFSFKVIVSFAIFPLVLIFFARLIKSVSRGSVPYKLKYVVFGSALEIIIPASIFSSLSRITPLA